MLGFSPRLVLIDYVILDIMPSQKLRPPDLG